MVNKRLGVAILVMLVIALSAYAQDEGPGFDFGLDLGLGAQSFNEADGPVTYQTLTLRPDFAIGDFGIGLELAFNYRFNPSDPNNNFVIRKEDWVPDANTSFLELYLPKFRYVRWAYKGDPLYVKLGSIDDATLGNGFVMANYANTLFLPDKRIFGLALDVDGRLFNFPIIGMESFVGNVANPDVLGVRGYVRPLITTRIPIVSLLEFGVTYATDLDPERFLDTPTGTVDPISIVDADFRMPLVSKPWISSMLFGDLAFEPSSAGGMVGLGGRFVGFLPYTLQVRFLGTNFIPNYFNATYDLYRTESAMIVTGQAAENIPAYAGWLTGTGFSVIEDMLAFNVSLDGPFGTPAPGLAYADDGSWVNYPHLRGTFEVAQGLVPNFSFQAFYDKRKIRYTDFFSDLVDPVEAAIGARINYYSGPAVITLTYDLRKNPNQDPAVSGDEWTVNAGLETSISF